MNEIKNFIKLVELTDPSNQSAFRSIVSEGCRLIPGADQELATHFEVSKTTVARWKTGAANPHPVARAEIFSFLRRLASSF